jgi:hypothetical protein
VFDRTVDLDWVPDGYRAMADHEAKMMQHLKRFADQGDNELSAEVLAGQGTGAGTACLPVAQGSVMPASWRIKKGLGGSSSFPGTVHRSLMPVEADLKA